MLKPNIYKICIKNVNKLYLILHFQDRVWYEEYTAVNTLVLERLLQPQTLQSIITVILSTNEKPCWILHDVGNSPYYLL